MMIMNPMRRLAKNKEGASAVEFSLLATPFFMLLFSVFELGWFFFSNAMLDQAILDGSRGIRTGQVQNASLTVDQFTDTYICPRMGVFGTCDDILTVDVRTFTSYAALLAATDDALACPDDQQSVKDAMQFDAGVQNTIVRVRLCFAFDTINPAVGLSLQGSNGGPRRVISEHVIRTEPYE